MAFCLCPEAFEPNFPYYDITMGNLIKTVLISTCPNSSQINYRSRTDAWPIVSAACGMMNVVNKTKHGLGFLHCAKLCSIISDASKRIDHEDCTGLYVELAIHLNYCVAPVRIYNYFTNNAQVEH